jgi:predicted ATP-dependent protease
MYFSEYDKHLKLYRYGFMSLSPSKKGLKLDEFEVLFSKYDCLLEFDLLKHFEGLINNLESANTIESIFLEKKAIEHELKVIFGVGHYRELMEDHVKMDVDKIDFIRPISLCFRRSDVKIQLLGKGMADFPEDLIKLILVKKNFDNYNINKDENVELLGNDKFDAIIARDSKEINKLMNVLSLSSNDLEHFLN